MSLRIPILIASAFLVCISPTVVLAADPPAQDSDATLSRARELFDKASALAKKHKYEEARKTFEEAWNLKKNWQTAAGLGWGELNTQQYGASAQHMAYALRVAPPDDDPADLRFYGTVYDKAKSQVATVRLRGVGQDATVVVDSKPRDALFQADPVFLEPGTHAIEVRHADGSRNTRSIVAEAGTTLELNMAAEAIAKAPASATPSASIASAPAAASPSQTSPPPPVYEVTTQGWKPRTWTLVSEGALAAVALGVGVGFALRASSLDSDATSARAAMGSRSACQVASPECTNLASTYEDRDTAAKWAKVGLATGGVLGLATVATLVLWPRSRSTANVTISPIAGHTTGLGVQGSF